MAPTSCGVHTAEFRENEERAAHEKYWMEHSAELTVEAMMLDSQAAKLDEEERPEILSSIPTVAGKRVIELGAGIGRFTGMLAREASHVLAMDFMQKSIEKNKELNGCYGNVDFLCADVTSPDLDKEIRPEDADLVFSNWLLMYLSDPEVIALINRVMEWLKPGGYLFFRESCFHQSGDLKRANNPTHYRNTSFYFKVVEDCIGEDSRGSYFKFNLVSSKCVGAYVRNKKNQNQICWLWEKVPTAAPQEKSFQKFLDSVQYTKTGILRYERIFGEGYVSTGGIKTTKEFVDKLELKTGDKVLDVGCGIGGGDFYMAETYGAEVTGIDLSVNMISLALERAIGQKLSCQFEVADCTKREFPEESFDVIYSRDTLLHIESKASLFEKFYKWLKPGGRLLITDYCKSGEATSENFEAYIKQRGYFLHDVRTYGQMLSSAGFVDVVAEDRTQQFLEILSAELENTCAGKELFIADFCESDYNYIVNGWEAKLQRCARGEQKWGLFVALKR